ncbi:MAG TPA: YCF48-related protein [Thermoanaerobaculia bacterium]|nr:YCF48-related protein [Thermoanaerobaculia bacterium]
MRRILIGTLLLGWITAGLALATPAGPTCQAVDGFFSHVWGGKVQSAFVHDASPWVAWTAEDGGRIRTTRDGGTHWTFQTTPPCVQGQLRGVQFLAANPRTGWAVGDGGVVIHTTTAGQTWDCLAPQTDPDGLPAELWAVSFRDLQNGWIAGRHLLRRTTDGGQTWTDVAVHHPTLPGFTLADVEVYSLSVLAAGSGYTVLASAEPGLVLRSDATSGGATWEVVYDVCLAPPLCSACAPNPCSTTTRLELWDVELVPGATSLAQAEAVAVGGYGNQCAVHLASQDGGSTWHQELTVDDPCSSSTCPGTGTVPGAPTQYGTTAFADHTALSVGYGGTILRRDPACTPPVWRPEPQIQGPHGPFTQPFYGVDGNGAGGGAGVAWITSIFNGIFKTADGGATWTPQTIANQIIRFGTLHFADATNGWAAGQFFRIAKTTDGGVTWADQAAPSGAGTLADILFAPGAQTGVAVGGFYNGSGVLKILCTGDGGVTWEDPRSIVPPPGPGDHRLAAVTWTGGTQFWTVGASSTVLLTADGGLHWSTAPLVLGSTPVPDASLAGVAFSDPDTGLVVGSQGGRGRIYLLTHATDPATRAWSELSPPAMAGVVDFSGVAVRGVQAYVVGQKGSGAGQAGVIYRWNGTAFVEETGTPPLPPCLDEQGLGARFDEVAISPSGTRVFVGGTCGRFLRFDGTAWQELKSQTSFRLKSLSFFADTDGFVYGSGGSHGVIVRYSGN